MTTPAPIPFSIKGRSRRIPRLVLLLHAGLPLVQEGGPRVNTDELREDWHDVDAISARLCGTWAFNPCAGEPYAIWN